MINTTDKLIPHFFEKIFNFLLKSIFTKNFHHRYLKGISVFKTLFKTSNMEHLWPGSECISERFRNPTLLFSANTLSNILAISQRDSKKFPKILQKRTATVYLKSNLELVILSKNAVTRTYWIDLAGKVLGENISL